MAPAAVEAGADIVVVQSTVTTARHDPAATGGLVFAELIESLKVPVIVGNWRQLQRGPGVNGNGR